MKEILARYLSRYGEPSQEQMDSAVEAVWQKLELEAGSMSMSVHRRSETSRVWHLAAVLAAAAGITLIIFFQMPRPIEARALLAEGTLARVSGKGPVFARAGERIEVGELLRMGEKNGSITLADGSRIEMRSHTEFSLEPAEDGVRIHLFKGGLIINAARQVAGHLYVQTKDVTVSVIGTVFLVNAEEEGSRVAVIEGEVRVQQGSRTKNLLPGDQLSTNPKMPPLKVPEEVAWSRNAEVHVALLQQSTTPPVSAAPKRLVFEAASLRQGTGGADPLVGCKGVDGVWSSNYRINDAARAVPLGRCTGVIGLRSALIWLFDVRNDGEPSAGRLLGTDQEPFDHLYQLEAKADDPTTATKADLQEMLRNLLIDRFKLRIRREEKGTETGYELHVATDGVKFKEASGDEDGNWGRPPRGCQAPCPIVISGNFTMKRFARFMGTLWTGNGMVVDKTGLTGLYEINLTLNPVPELPRPASTGPRGGNGNAGGLPREFKPSLAKAMEEQLGLRLEWGRQIPAERWVVEHIEMPTEN